MKSFTYQSPMVIEECWDRTWNHWTQQSGCEITKHQFYENDQQRTLTLRRSANFISWGETYYFTFLRSAPGSTHQTEIKIEISLAFGYGAQWYAPYKKIEKWCETMQLEPIVFGKTEMIVTYSILGVFCLLPMLVMTVSMFFLG